MTDLDRLLRDPRSHKAVPQKDMVAKVNASVLQTWATEQVKSTSQQVRRKIAVRFGAMWAGLILLSMTVTLLSAYLPGLPRLDLMLKYGIYDMVDATAAGVMEAPMQTALLLTGLAATVGFGLSAQARQAFRQIL